MDYLNYFIDSSENDVTKCFASEREFACSEGLRKPGKTSFSVESLEDSTCVMVPQKYTKEQLLNLANKFEAEAKQKNTQPLLLRSQVELYYGGINRHYDLTTSKKDLNFNPKPGKEALDEYFGRIFINIKRKGNI